jgi:TatD DNase family protein
MATNDRVVAIGEIGLDYYRDLSPRPDQRRVFEAQLEIGDRTSLPVVIHSRDAAEDTYVILNQWLGRSRPRGDGPPGLIHCFGYDAAWAERFLQMGFYISIPGTVTYPKAEAIRAVASSIPETAMTVETDCPYLAPQSRRGRRNEPAYLTETVETIAGLRGVDAEYLALQTAANARRLYRLEGIGGGEGQP